MALKFLLVFLPNHTYPRQEKRFISYYLHLIIASSFFKVLWKYLKHHVKHAILCNLAFTFFFFLVTSIKGIQSSKT